MPNNYITETNKKGKATFTTRVPSEHHAIPLFPGGTLSQGSLQSIYYTAVYRPDVISTHNDILQYANVRENGLPKSQYAPPHGTIVNLVTLGSGFDGPWHRTSTLDILFVLEGSVELTLDGGESRLLVPGDSIVQRATNHRWRNVTGKSGVVRMVAMSQPVVKLNNGLWA